MSRDGRRLPTALRGPAVRHHPFSRPTALSGEARRHGARPGRAAHRGERGQSTLETVALLPLVAAVALAIGHLLAAGLAHELAGSAAEAGAIAALRGGDAEATVRSALPEWSQGRVAVAVRGRSVRVRLEPPAVVPGLGRLLATTVRADAGPAR